jgi:hypothetical protein
MPFGRFAKSAKSARRGTPYSSGVHHPSAIAAAAAAASAAAAAVALASASAAAAVVSAAAAASAAATAAAAAAAEALATAAVGAEIEPNSSSEPDNGEPQFSSSSSSSSSVAHQQRPVDYSIDNWFVSPFTMVTACDCQPVPIGPMDESRSPHAYHEDWHHECGRLMLRLGGRNLSSGCTRASSSVRAAISPHQIETYSCVSHSPPLVFLIFISLILMFSLLVWHMFLSRQR